MSDVVIKIEGLSKCYRLGQYVGVGAYQYRALRDVLTDVMCAPFRRLRARSKQRAVGSNPTADSHEPSANFIWALKDVSFEVKQGEVVGIIGRNGAGKSTLLKVLSRITEPTKGRAEIKGRLGSLLEVGTGFHPELTGRENIYLSGAILGMTKKEIDRKFDDIVDFSGIEKFINTPVKRYSSGMLVRLGFAVAAHLEPEILLVDEVLAVGDVAFQKKCLGKMKDVASGGRTVLLVSHNMQSINSLCNRAILLENGRIAYSGSTTEAINKYLKEGKTNKNGKLKWVSPEKELPFSDVVKIKHYCIMDDDGVVAGGKLSNSRSYSISVELDILQSNQNIRIAYATYSEDQSLLLTSSVNDEGKINLGEIKPGSYIFSAPIPVDLFSDGTYEIELLCLVECLGWILPVGNESRIKFIFFRDICPNPFPANRLGGVVSPLSPVLEWTVTKIDSGGNAQLKKDPWRYAHE